MDHYCMGLAVEVCCALALTRSLSDASENVTIKKALRFCKPTAALRYLPRVTRNLFLIITFFTHFSSSAEKNPKLAVPPNPFLTQFLPTILLWSFAAMLPAVVSWSSYFEAHWTR